MTNINKLNVRIDGKIFTLQGTESEEYMQLLAEYIDNKIACVKNTKPITTSGFDLNNLYMLINIADDLYKEKKVSEQLTNSLQEKNNELESYKDELSKAIEESILLKEKLYECQLNLSNAKKELDDYISLFGKG